MTYPRGYQPKKQNTQDESHPSKNNSTNNKNINKKENNSIEPPITTIGEAVKEAVETGKEVVVAGPQAAGELTGIVENEQDGNIPNLSKENLNDKTNLNNITKDNSKLEVNVTKSPNETASSPKEEKIILNPKDSENGEEATLKTVTTIPTEGVNVEAETDITVPLKDKEENIEAETDVQVNPMTTTTTNTTTSPKSTLESKDLEKISPPSLEEESSQLKTKVKPESHIDDIKPDISQEQDRKILPPSSSVPPSQEQQTKNIDASNPFIMYTTFWQNFMSNWFNTYNEFLKNLMKINGFWFRKS
jgi:hypothetical protein